MKKKVVHEDDSEVFAFWDFDKPFVLSKEDFALLEQLLEDPPEPTQALIDLMSLPDLPERSQEESDRLVQQCVPETWSPGKNCSNWSL